MSEILRILEYMRFYTTILFLVLFFPLLAQTETEFADAEDTLGIRRSNGPSFMAFSAGRTHVKGEFGAMSGKNASCALNGLGLSLEGAYFFTRNFGAAARLGISLNRVDQESYYTNHVPAAPAGGIVRNGINDTEVPYAMAGPSFAFAAGKVVFDLHVSAGIMMMSKGRDYQMTQAYATGMEYEYHEREFRGNAFCYGGGAGVRFDLPARTLFQLRADHVQGIIKGTQRIDVISAGVKQTDYEQLQRPVSFLYISAGFGYRFTAAHDGE